MAAKSKARALTKSLTSRKLLTDFQIKQLGLHRIVWVRRLWNFREVNVKRKFKVAPPSTGILLPKWIGDVKYP
jgi:hypothetical protein